MTGPLPLEAAWPQLLLVLAALVLVPLGLRLSAPREGSRALRIVKRALLPAALLLGLAHLLPRGPLAAALALPWLGVTAAIALLGLARLLRRGPRPIAETCLDAAWIYLAVGGAWALADRLGFRPLGFAVPIVLLTAVHFHYAGFVLPVATGLALRRQGGRAAALAGALVIAGVPLVAVGITATQLGAGPALETGAAALLALGGAAAAGLHLRLAIRPGAPPLARVLWTVAGLSLLGSMVLAALYGARTYAPVPWLDIPWMAALHGTANALGFGFAGLLGWSVASAPRGCPRQEHGL